MILRGKADEPRRITWRTVSFSAGILWDVPNPFAPSVPFTGTRAISAGSIRTPDAPRFWVFHPTASTAAIIRPDCMPPVKMKDLQFKINSHPATLSPSVEPEARKATGPRCADDGFLPQNVGYHPANRGLDQSGIRHPSASKPVPDGRGGGLPTPVVLNLTEPALVTTFPAGAQVSIRS